MRETAYLKIRPTIFLVTGPVRRVLARKVEVLEPPLDASQSQSI